MKLLLRLLLGSFFGHGTQKLFGWFGGHGLEGTAVFMESLGMRPGRRHATVAGASEAAGGALLALGLFTPLSATLITSVMTQAIRSVHGAKGPWVSEGGWEYNAAVIATVGTFAQRGPGAVSLDRALGTEVCGVPVALAAVAAGVAGPLLLVRPEAGPAESATEAATAPLGDPAAATAS